MSEKSIPGQQARAALQDFIEQFEPFFNEHLSTTQTKLNEISNDNLGVFPVLADIATRKAKRLRAALCYHTYFMCGGTDQTVALQLGAFLEINHAYLLIIDDIMDRANLRRGGPTAQIIFTKRYRQLDKNAHLEIPPDHYGTSLAINSGILGTHLAHQLLANIDLPADVILRILETANLNFTKTALGQARDVTNPVLESVSEQDIYDTLSLKSGIYTYANPITIGALAAGVTDRAELDQLTGYAIPGGIAFQIQDDIIGMFSETDEMGKSSLDDMCESKYTLLAHHTLQHATGSDRDALEHCLGNRDATEEDLINIREIMTRLGSYDYAKQKARDFTDQAQASLANPPADWHRDHLTWLHDIAEYIINRSS